MKPYGLRNKLRVNLPDNHPKKGWVNWWEAELNTVKSKKTARQKIKATLNILTKIF
jgi:hypothetical protein